MVTIEQETLAQQMLKVQEDYKEGIISRMENSLYLKNLSIKLLEASDPKDPIQKLLRQAADHNIKKCEERIKIELELAKAVIHAYELANRNL